MNKIPGLVLRTSTNKEMQGILYKNKNDIKMVEIKSGSMTNNAW